jgi:transcription initiation factor IIF auxiliary subunit
VNERMQREIVLSFLLHAWTEGSSLSSQQLHQEHDQIVKNNPDSGTTSPHMNLFPEYPAKMLDQVWPSMS